MSSISINYARAEGIYKSELAAPIIFIVAYIPLFFFNVYRSIRHPTYVLIVLAIFCASTCYTQYRRYPPLISLLSRSSCHRLYYASYISRQRYRRHESEPRHRTVGYLQRRILRLAVLCVHPCYRQVRRNISPTAQRISSGHLYREKMLPQSQTPAQGVLGLLSRLMLNSHLVRLVLLVAVVLGIIGGVRASYLTLIYSRLTIFC